MVSDDSAPSLLHGDALKDATRRLAGELRTKIAGTQGGVPTFADNVLLGAIRQLEAFESSEGWEDSLAAVSERADALKLALRHLQLLIARRDLGRLVDYADRVQMPGGIHGASDIGYTDMVLSQGATDCLQWKGMPLFKTAFDFALYPLLLWEVRPRTLIELGSGTGASAVWLADLLDTFEIACSLYSMDLTPPPMQDSRIEFIEGDSRTIDQVFGESRRETVVHPLLLIEDAHVNVDGVLRHFHAWTQPGDYLIVEDSPGKQETIGRFLSEVPGCYKVDTRYTDFFGRNATCAQDSIFVRV